MERFEEAERMAEQQRRAQENFHRSLRESAESDLEARRLDDAAQQLRQIDGLRPENWQKMDIYERKAILNQAGEVLESTYHSPRPPLQVENLGDRHTLGSYGDGYKYNAVTGEVEGADYKISMNEQGVRDSTTLFGDDPRQALRTYAHEFRHSYQAEQVTRFEQPQFRNLVDVPDEAADWSINNRDYRPPDGDFEAYWNQPVERDSRAFADALIERVYR